MINPRWGYVLCAKCWEKDNSGLEPPTERAADLADCGRCGEEVTDGIVVRYKPTSENLEYRRCSACENFVWSDDRRAQDEGVDPNDLVVAVEETEASFKATVFGAGDQNPPPGDYYHASKYDLGMDTHEPMSCAEEVFQEWFAAVLQNESEKLRGPKRKSARHTRAKKSKAKRQQQQSTVIEEQATYPECPMCQKQVGLLTEQEEQDFLESMNRPENAQAIMNEELAEKEAKRFHSALHRTFAEEEAALSRPLRTGADD
jgi:hypothetical protein